MLLPQLTQLDQDNAMFGQCILEGLEAAHHAASVLRSVYTRMWSLPAERVLALLNSDIPRSLAVLQANTAQGTALNASLDLNPLPQFPTRAPVTMPTGYAFEGGQFTYTAPQPEGGE